MISPLNYLSELERVLSIEYIMLKDVGLEKIAEMVSGLSGESLIIQAIPSKLVLGWQQLALPAYLTWESLKEGYGPSKKAHIQYLLFFTATRQISKAVNKLRRYSSNSYILIVAHPRRTQEARISLEEAVRVLPHGILRKLAEDEVGREADLEAVKNFYGLKGFHDLTSVEDLLLAVLTEIAYSKIEILK